MQLPNETRWWITPAIREASGDRLNQIVLTAAEDALLERHSS